MIKIHLSGTKKEIEEFIPSIQEIATIHNTSDFQANRNNRFFSKHLEITARKIIRIPPMELSKYQG